MATPSLKRGRFTGVLNIITFNRPMYLIASLVTLVLFAAGMTLHSDLLLLIAIISLVPVFVSLAASFLIYDLSEIYVLNVIEQITLPKQARLLNLTAGFDETSIRLKEKLPAATLDIRDFYNATQHTEPSIRRARALYPLHPDCRSLSTEHPDLPTDHYNLICGIFALHEIRNNEERISFLKVLANALTPDGTLLITEHLRDLPNFAAFSIGAFHFHSKQTWLSNLKAAGLQLIHHETHTPFVHHFLLKQP